MMVLLTWHFLYTQDLRVINSHRLCEVLNEGKSVANRIMLLPFFQYDTFLCWYLWFFCVCVLYFRTLLNFVACLNTSERWQCPKITSSSWLALGYLDSSLLYFLILKKWFLPDLIDVVYFKIDTPTQHFLNFPEFIFLCLLFFNSIILNCLKS